MFCDERANFEHVCLKDGAVFAVEVEGIVFQERATLLHALTHEPHGAVESGRLPVTFSAEAVAFSHQSLRSEAGDLVKQTEVVKVGCESFGTFIFQDTTQGDFSLGGVPDFRICFALGVFQCSIMFVEFEVGVYECLHFFVRSFLVIFHQVVHRTIVYVVTQALFGFHFIAVGYGYIVHLVAKAEDQHILRISPSGADTHPDSNLVQCILILPIAYNHFATDTHAGADMSELAVAVSRLVEVHEIHIHGIPRYFLVELGMQVKQGFLELLQAVNPHLCRRESMHPSDDTDTFVIIVGSLEYGLHFFRGVYCAFIYNFDRQFPGIVQACNHFIGMCINSNNSVTSIKELCSGDEPYFIIFESHSIVFYWLY